MRRRQSNGPPEDDWLAEEDWLEAPTQETPPTPSRRRRPQPPAGAPSRRLLALVAAVSILVLVILVAVLQGGDEAAEPTPTAPPTETSAAPQTETEASLRLPAGATLAEGDSGPRVRRLQRALASLGYEVTPDGEFGPGTTGAVRAFQEEAGLDADGVVGSGTVQAVNDALAERG